MARNKKEMENVDTTDLAEFPGGRPKDESAEGAGDGSAITEASGEADIYQFFAILMKKAEIDYNKQPETFTLSQYWDAFEQLFTTKLYLMSNVPHVNDVYGKSATYEKKTTTVPFRIECGAEYSSNFDVKIERVGSQLFLTFPEDTKSFTENGEWRVAAQAVLPAWAEPVSNARGVGLVHFSSGDFGVVPPPQPVMAHFDWREATKEFRIWDTTMRDPNSGTSLYMTGGKGIAGVAKCVLVLSAAA